MLLKETPIWLEGVTFPETDPAQPLPAHADVAIVGGGYTGLAAARELSRRGASVALLEARTLGWGASSRNGGMVLTGLKLEAEQLVTKYGLATARRLFAASLRALDYVERIVAEERIECDFARSGHLLLACKPAHYQAFAREAELLERDFGHPTRVLAAGELRGEIGSSAYYGGLVDEASAGVNPARYVAGLARAAQRAGAQLYERAPVERIERQPAGWRLSTPRGTLRAGAVLLATGGYSGPATPALRRRIVPLGSYIITTEPLPEPLARELIPRERMIFDSKRFLYYFRLTPDRRMLFGGRAGFFSETPATVRDSAEILRRGMLQVYPQLRDARIEHAWGGTLDVTFDMMPHAGQIDGLHYAIGYAGHGVAMASYLGSLLGACLAGEQVDNPFTELPFPGAPLGLYNGRPWFLPLVGAWYKFLDWMS
ncbi:MAG TPA: FAD-binding oxidoreductase [Roseiflexaceae bacterium]|nr:FAD-binding oxidoreductase [Roseiflexaceae bacterium]